MFKIFDYRCVGCEVIEERMIDTEEVVQLCKKCDRVMLREISPVRGYVKDTQNRTKC